MYYQNKNGFYLYHYDILGNLYSNRYPTLEDFFRCHSEFYIKTTLVYKINKKITAPIVGDYFSSYASVLYDQDGLLYVPDRLLGLYRYWKISRNLSFISNWSSRFHNGAKRRATSGYRKIRTFQESKMWFDVDPDYNIKGRARRSKANLPNSWDDYWSHNEKSWKFQSTRKHQYK